MTLFTAIATIGLIKEMAMTLFTAKVAMMLYMVNLAMTIFGVVKTTTS